MIRLIVKKGRETFGEYEFTKDRVTIGRLPENDIVLSMGGVSRNHASIQRTRDGYLIENHSSVGKIHVNGDEIENFLLRNSDEIHIEPFDIKVSIDEEGVTVSAGVSIQRPKRWDVPYGETMTDADVDYILQFAPFKDIDYDAFPKTATIKDILRNDARLSHYKKGDIVIREGDYGNSAFFILSGSVRVVLGRGEEGLPPSALGRSKRQSKSLFSAVAQLWTNSSLPESRNPKKYKGAISKREDKEGTRIVLQDIPAVLNKYNTAVLKDGEIFGEIAALSRTPRTASLFAEEDSELVEIRWQGLRDIRKRAAALKEHIDKIYRERNLLFQIKETPLFKNLSSEQLDEVVKNTIFETFGDFEWYTSFKKTSGSARIGKEPVIAGEGNYPDGVIMIRSGFARLSQKAGNGHRTLAYLGRGHIYGVEEIAHNWRSKQQVFLQRSVRAVGYTDVLIVPTKTMEEIVLPSLPPDELPELINPYQLKEQAEETSEALQSLGSHMMEFLVENRFINGTATMMINLDRCTRCDDCVRACANGHNNNPRFIRHGKQIDKFMIANACMHCADPVCMLGCPTGAIHRDVKGQVVVNDITCIGCATCANSCPYSNIRMVEVRNKKGEFITDEETKAPIPKATKCDLCVDQLGGPACERACPHDALKRVDMTNLKLLAEWISR